jgi:hypothetical protein
MRKRQEIQTVLRKKFISDVIRCVKVVNAMVELDQMKQELQTYESPLAEVRDSL